MNIHKWLLYAQKKLINSITPRLDAEILLRFVLKFSKKDLFYYPNKRIKKNNLLILNNLLYRRILGEPIAYIIKKKEFWSFSLFVSFGVLIPRPETEILVEQVLLKISLSANCILDLGTGSGAIALALASEASFCKITAIDKNLTALSIAQYNANKLNIKNVNFMYSDWFSNVPINTFHIIVCNPPYLSKKDFYNSVHDLSYEPYDALVSGVDGMKSIRYIIKNSFYYFSASASSGWLYIEHCYKQTKMIKNLLKSNFFMNISSVKDYSHRNRVTYGCLNKKFNFY